MKDVYTQIAAAIVKQQESVVGPLAWSEARKVRGLVIHDSAITVGDDGKAVVEALVKQYEILFGRASVEVCKEAIKNLRDSMTDDDLPTILR